MRSTPTIPPLLFCLSRSVLKRRALLLLPVPAVMGASLMLTGSAPLSLLLTAAALLLSSALVCMNSYRRHVHEFSGQSLFLDLMVQRRARRTVDSCSPAPSGSAFLTWHRPPHTAAQ